jgi:transposase-like protein
MEDLSTFFCPEHGKRGGGNIAVRARYGPHQRRLLYCKKCQKRFSERRGTPLFDSRLHPDKAHSVFDHLREGCGVRQTSRLVGVATNTVLRLARKAGEHAEAAHDELVGFSPLYREGPAR